jgi:hypothetical protein
MKRLPQHLKTVHLVRREDRQLLQGQEHQQLTELLLRLLPEQKEAYKKKDFKTHQFLKILHQWNLEQTLLFY